MTDSIQKPRSPEEEVLLKLLKKRDIPEFNEKHAQWRADPSRINNEPHNRLNLAEADLQGADLRKADLEGANLEDANLQYAKLNAANLTGANLRKANLWGANLGFAKLQGANLIDADLRNATLSLADLRDANLQGAKLQGAKLQGAKLRRADLRGANLKDVNLRDADLQGAIFSSADQVTIARQGSGWFIINENPIIRPLEVSEAVTPASAPTPAASIIPEGLAAKLNDYNFPVQPIVVKGLPTRFIISDKELDNDAKLKNILEKAINISGQDMRFADKITAVQKVVFNHNFREHLSNQAAEIIAAAFDKDPKAMQQAVQEERNTKKSAAPAR
jgi:hypothetical protein